MTQLNDKYWSIKEVAKEAGCSYAVIYQHVMKKYDKLVKYGTTYLIPDEKAKEIIQKFKNKEGLVGFCNSYKMLGTSSIVINYLVNKGLPTKKIEQKTYIENSVYEIMTPIIKKYQEQYKCIPMSKYDDIWQEIKTELEKNKKQITGVQNVQKS